MHYTWSSGSKVLFVSDYPSYVDFRNGYVWSDRTSHTILHEDLGLTFEECTFTSLCKPEQAGFEFSKKNSDHIESRRKWGIELMMLVDQIKPDLIACNSTYAFDLLAQSVHAGGIGKRIGLIYDVKFGSRTSKLIATTNPEFAAYRSSSKEEFIASCQSGIAAVKPKRKTEFTWVNDPELLVHMVDNIINLSDEGKLPVHNMVAIDIEAAAVYDNEDDEGGTSSAYKPENNIATTQIAWDLGKAISIPLIYEGSAFNNERNIKVYVEQMKRILDKVRVCGHNYRYDESYFRTKLGIKTENFWFDTMLAHKFLFTHLPKSLDFVTSRWLMWPSHKRIISAELAAMPKEIRSYGLLSQPVIFEYGCLDADATLQAADIIIKKLQERTYEEFDVEIIYDNAYTAFRERIMFPWQALTDMEIEGAVVDVDQLPIVAASLKADMDAAIDIIHTSKSYQKWIDNNTTPNPKRFKHKTKSFWNILCRTCSKESPHAWHDPKKRKAATPPDCPECTSSDVMWKRRMKPTGEKIEVLDQPVNIVADLNLGSPPQMQKFFYSTEYLNIPQHEKHGTSTDKDAREYMKEYAAKHGLAEHESIVDALGDYNAVAKLYTAYATKLGNFIWVHNEEEQVSDAVTAPYELPLPINTLHAHMLQDGTHSGRLASRDPSLHTIPSRGVRGSLIKKMFVSRFGAEGLIGQADLSQAEVRAFCIETLDPSLQDAFVRGVDPYIGVAAKVQGILELAVSPEQRQDIKSVVLGLLFGRGAGAIADQTGKTYQEAQQLIDDVFAGAPLVQKWVGNMHDSVHKLGLVVTRFGRVRDLKDYIWSNDSGKVNHAENISQNHPIQGLVGDLVIDSVARMSYRMRAEKLRSVLFNTVHDSTILDIYLPELFQVLTIANEELFTKLPEYFPFVNVPFALDFDLGPSWGESVNISFEGNSFTANGNPQTADKVRKALSRFYVMQMTKTPEFNEEKGKVKLDWNLTSIPA